MECDEIIAEQADRIRLLMLLVDHLNHQMHGMKRRLMAMETNAEHAIHAVEAILHGKTVWRGPDGQRWSRQGDRIMPV